MHGIRGISEKLDRLLEPLVLRDLAHIVDVALSIALEEYQHAPDIRGAIEAYRADPVAARELADDLSVLSKMCDADYIRSEDAGDVKRSQSEFRKMCVLDGLHALLSSASLSPEVVDNFMYNLGHGSTDTDLFAERMIERLQ